MVSASSTDLFGLGEGFRTSRFKYQVFFSEKLLRTKRDRLFVHSFGEKFFSSRQCASRRNDSYLVDPASSHMLVSKIKPCMSKYKQICTVKLRMAH